MTKNTNRVNKLLTLQQDKLCAIPAHSDAKAKGYKGPCGSWKVFQSRFPTESELTQILNKHSENAFTGIVTGKVSGNLEIIDIDCKYDKDGAYNEADRLEKSGKLWERLQTMIKNSLPQFYDNMIYETTTSKGFHIFYRCETIAKNQALAKGINDKVLIETRGEGGFIVCDPSDGYELQSDGLDCIPTITVEEREKLLFICRTLSEKTISIKTDKKDFSINKAKIKNTCYDRYNQATSIADLLETDGFTILGERNGWIDVLRSGNDTKSSKSGGIAITDNVEILNMFSSSTRYPSGRGLTASSVFHIQQGRDLDNKTDWTATRKDLQELGFVDEDWSDNRKELISRIANKCLAQKEVSKESIDRMIETDLSEMITEDDEEGLTEKLTIGIQSLIEKGFNPARNFWVDVEKSKGKLVPQMDCAALKRSLQLYGLHKVNINGDKFVGLVNTETKRIRICEKVEDIREILRDICNTNDFIDWTQISHPKSQIVSASISLQTNQIINVMHSLDDRNIKLYKHTKNRSCYFFNNGYVEVRKESIEFKEYSELPKNVYVYEESVLDYHFYESYLSIEFDNDIKDFCFSHFLMRLAGVDPTDYKPTERLTDLHKAIGYLADPWKDSANSKAILIEENTLNSENGGGAGKTVVIKGIGKLAPTVRIDGKSWKKDKSFHWQSVQRNTRIVFIDDLKNNFDIESLNNDITDGIEIEKKNRDPFSLTGSEAPKFALATNYSVNTDAVFLSRRYVRVLVDTYFSKYHTPIDEYKHRFFDDWKDTDYFKLFSLLFYCVRQYKLTNGLIRSTKPTINSKIKTFRQDISHKEYESTVLNFFTRFFKNIKVNDKEIAETTAYEMRIDFRDRTNISETEITKNQFGAMVSSWCNVMSINLSKRDCKLSTKSGKIRTQKYILQGDWEVIKTELESLSNLRKISDTVVSDNSHSVSDIRHDLPDFDSKSDDITTIGLSQSNSNR